MRVLFRSAAVVFGAVAMVLGMGQILGVGLAGANVKPVAAPQSQGHMVYRGKVNLAATAARNGSRGPARGGLYPARRLDPGDLKSEPPATVPAPNPAASTIVPRAGGANGFVGLTTADSAAVNGFDVEPPDQGLCAHRGTVLEAVNLAVRTYSESGKPLTPVLSLNRFFGLPPAVSFSHDHPTFGPFLSDPRCYYDAQTGRWFLTALEISVNPSTGAFGDRSAELIAVSQTSDPTGNYGLFSFGTTNNGGGTPAEPNCPCFGDQPRIGADANGFYISTDSYPITGAFNSNGGELYAISKQGLAAAATGAAPPPSLVAIHVGAENIGGFPANALQPAETPEHGSYAANREYFLNTPDFNGFATMGGAGAKAVVLWTLSNTSSLADASPSITLSHAILPSETYAPPVSAAQKPGPRPLGEAHGSPLAPISVNDDRMQQVEYVNGRLFSSLNTGVGPGGNADRSGVAWFVVTPNGTAGAVSKQGYLAAGEGASLMYPSIGLDQAGLGAMTFSVSGPTYYPSAAYLPFGGPAAASGPIYLNGPGVAPEDGFTCYAATGFGPSCRWGDYSASSSDGNGNIVMGNEMIAATPRDEEANWSTFISTFPR